MNKRVPIVFDSGVHAHIVFKALAKVVQMLSCCGATIKFFYGLNLGGAEGVNSVIEQLNKELRITTDVRVAQETSKKFKQTHSSIYRC